MCGRFVQYVWLAMLEEMFDLERIEGEVQPSYNVTPSQSLAAVVADNGNCLRNFYWGLVPFWARENARMTGPINARCETVADKPTFREAFKRKRCLIPANGFYEWEKTGTGKQPWYFVLPSEQPFAFAGIWDNWIRSDGSHYGSCAIITRAASTSVLPIHERMPVILDRQAWRQWLDPNFTERDHLHQLLDNLCSARTKTTSSGQTSKLAGKQRLPLHRSDHDRQTTGAFLMSPHCLISIR